MIKVNVAEELLKNKSNLNKISKKSLKILAKNKIIYIPSIYCNNRTPFLLCGGKKLIKDLEKKSDFANFFKEKRKTTDL